MLRPLVLQLQNRLFLSLRSCSAKMTSCSEQAHATLGRQALQSQQPLFWPQPALLSHTPNLSDRPNGLKRVSGLVELAPSGKAFRLKLLEFAMARLAVLLPKIQAAYQKRLAYSKTHRLFLASSQLLCQVVACMRLLCTL